MLKSLGKVAIKALPWITGTALFAGAIVLVAHQQHAAAQKYETEREIHCSRSFPLDPEKQETCKHERDGPSNYLAWWYVLVAWPEGITAWAIILTLVVVGWQSNQTRKAAKAALEEVEIQAAGQRAWVVIRSGMEESYAPTKEEHPRFWWIVKNYGTTPAQILETQCRYELVETSFLFRLPDPPDYPAPILLEGAILVPKEPMYYSTFLQNRMDSLRILHSFSDAQLHELEEGTLWLLAYGYVKYRDGIGPEIRESNFVANYVWRKSEHQLWEVGFRPVIRVPKAYTKCT